MEGSIFKKLNISLDLGRILNKNKNPVAENAVKEFHKERLKLDPHGGPITKLDLSILTRNMNSRIRTRGLSAKEIVFQRDQVSNKAKPVDDEKIADIQFENRTKQHPTKNKISSEADVKVGDNVFLKNDKNKLRGREMYKVIEVFSCNDEKWAKLIKSEKQLRKKTYDSKVSELFPVPGKAVEEQDLVFSVKLHLALRPLPLGHIPYPLRPLFLRRYPKSFIPKALSHIPYPLYQTPCPLTPSTVSFEKI